MYAVFNAAEELGIIYYTLCITMYIHWIADAASYMYVILCSCIVHVDHEEDVSLATGTLYSLSQATSWRYYNHHSHLLPLIII